MNDDTLPDNAPVHTVLLLARQYEQAAALAWKNEELKTNLSQALVELQMTKKALADLQQKLAAERKELTVDTLTGLYNRKYFEMEMEKIHAESERGVGYAMIFVDLDHFKEINDTYGHASGDEVLKSVGQTLGARRRREDRIIRWGGDEFIIVLPRCKNLKYAATIAEDVRSNIENSECQLSTGQKLKITASLGVAFAPPVDAEESKVSQLRDRVQTVFKHADMAVYAAKGKVPYDHVVHLS